MTGARRGSADRHRKGRAPRDVQRWSKAAPSTPPPTAGRPPTAGTKKAPPDEALHPRDRGPVRAYVRDVVDARRGLVGLFVPGFGGTLIAALGPASNLQRWLLVICVALLAVALLDALRLGVRVTRGARARFPGEVVDGWRTGFYAFMRAHRTRSLRLPPPRVAVGDPVP